MAEIHTPDEHIAVADLEAMVEVTLALVEAALRSARLWTVRCISVAALDTRIRHSVGRAVRVGVAKEIKSDEYRVALTPAGALELDQPRATRSSIETGAGDGSAFAGRRVRCASARGSRPSTRSGKADLVLKVKEPIAAEYRAAARRADALHLSAHRGRRAARRERSLDSGHRRPSRTRRSRSAGALPLLAPMSEVAGRLASQAGAYFLEKPLGGRGLLLGGVPGVAPGRVVIVGGGSSATTPRSSHSGSARR